MKNEDDSRHFLDSRRQLPACPMSTQCLLYADWLDGLDNSGSQGSQSAIEDDSDAREKRFIEQLRAHVPTCPTCRATLVEVRRQREAIRLSLRTGEREVPSTAARIIAAMRQESLMTPSTPQTSQEHERSPHDFLVQLPPVETPVPKQRRGSWMEFLSIAVAAAIVLLTIGVLGRFVLSHGNMGSATSSAGTASNGAGQTLSASWSSVIVTYKLDNKTVIANYNPLSGQHVELASFPQSQVSVDGVAHNAYQVLYHVYDGTNTRYYVYPQTQQPIYTVTGTGGSAFWSSADNDRYLFINTQQSIVQVDVVAHTSHLLSLPAKSPMALFYRDNYLYYVQAPNDLASYSSGILYRLDISISTSVPTMITSCPDPMNVWLSPVGSTVYYNCPSKSKNALFSVNGDGTNARLLRTDAGQLIGYASDNSLIVLLANNQHYQVVQLGANGQPDRVLLSDIAPGATSVQASDVAVAPYGYVLVARAVYANNVEKLVYGDLMTQATQEVQLPVGVHDIHAIGWDRLIPTPSGG